MDEQVINENKPRVQTSNVLFVCGVLSICGICTLISFGMIIWALQYEQQAYASNLTATAFSIATQQAQATATSIVRATEQAEYELIDRFDSHQGDWRKGLEYASDNGYWDGYITIKDGTYIWNVESTEKTFVSWSDAPQTAESRDFAMYVDTQLPDQPVGQICSGFVFRKSRQSDDSSSYYYFKLCNDAIARISIRVDGEWNRIETINIHNYSSEWNRLEVTAQGAYFTFTVNDVQIFAMNDYRLEAGDVGLVVEVKELIPALVLFDNFGYQPR